MNAQPKRDESAYWRRALRDAPVWALEDEMARRTSAVGPDPIDLPGVRVDPLTGDVDWRGGLFVFGGRRLELIYALATLHRQGRRFVIGKGHGTATTRGLCGILFPGWDEESACQNLRVIVNGINKLAPGLIVKRAANGRTWPVAYGLATDTNLAELEGAA